MGARRLHKIRLFSPLLTSLFHDHLHRVFAVLLYAISGSCDIDFAGQVVYKPWVPSLSSEVLMPITAILKLAADCVLLLHQLVIGPVTIHLNVLIFKYKHYIKCFANWVYRSVPAGIWTGFTGLASQFSTH